VAKPTPRGVAGVQKRPYAVLDARPSAEEGQHRPADRLRQLGPGLDDSNQGRVDSRPVRSLVFELRRKLGRKPDGDGAASALAACPLRRRQRGLQIRHPRFESGRGLSSFPPRFPLLLPYFQWVALLRLFGPPIYQSLPKSPEIAPKAPRRRSLRRTVTSQTGSKYGDAGRGREFLRAVAIRKDSRTLPAFHAISTLAGFLLGAPSAHEI
jgi:hypothetical protein